MRRIFSRSDLRRQALEKNAIEHFDPLRPRVTKWVYCSYCGVIFPKYLAQVDHVEPIIPLTKRLEDLTWNELIENMWCDISNLQTMDKDCHKEKTREENKLRRANRK